MSEFRIRKAEFIIGAFKLADIPPSDLPEVAFLGRSNVGKSSLINRLTGRKSLARVSSTPGRTQQINVFEIDALTRDNTPVLFSMVDLPGYGYARFSKARREVMSRLIVEYVERSPRLQVVCLLNDSKRLPEADELAIRDLCSAAGVHLLVCPTKCDRLKSKDLQKQLAAIARAYGLEQKDLVVTGEKTPAPKVWERILPLLS